MKYVDEFRSPAACHRLLREIRESSSRPWAIMDVCGGQTHGLVRSGIEQDLYNVVELIHGPGCPVCVTACEAIDMAILLSNRPNTLLASFGDMVRVPGSQTSLLHAKSNGAAVRIVYSPIDAVKIAAENQKLNVVFFAVGFETTIPATALAVLQAEAMGLRNFFLLGSHVRVLPAMEAIMQMPGSRVAGFLAAGHVCTITGFSQYDSFSERYQVPIVVTGFEPVDLLRGLFACVRQLESGVARAENQYGRSVRREGNGRAKRIVDRVYEVADQDWRGFGMIRNGGFRLRQEFRRFCASRLACETIAIPVSLSTDCRAADVMSGKIKPKQCPAFGNTCTPERPLGAPMVSSEGACAAYYRFNPKPVAIHTNEDF